MKVTSKGLVSVGRQPYNFASALAELIDNAIAADARRIEVTLEQHAGLIHGAVLDDGRGMTLPQLEDALNLGSASDGGLNEHGVGMKQALSWFMSDLQEPWDILTKAPDADPAYTAFDPDGEFEPEIVDAGPNPENRQGTRVTFRCDISKLSWAPKTTNLSGHMDWLRAYLGAIYRRILRSANPPRIFLHFDKEPAREVIPVEPEQDGNAHTAEYVADDESWKATLRIYRKKKPQLRDGNGDRYRMYSWSQANQGVDIIRTKRVMVLHDMDVLGRDRHPQRNWLFAELELPETFPTLVNKSGIYDSPEWKELVSKVREDATLDTLLGQKPSRTEKLSEADLQKQLQLVLEQSFELARSPASVDRDLDVETGGKIDLRITLDKGKSEPKQEYVIIETKVDDVDGGDVYQAFRYADEYAFKNRTVREIRVIGTSIKVRAQRSAEIIRKNHELDVKLEKWSDYQIKTEREVEIPTTTGKVVRRRRPKE